MLAIDSQLRELTQHSVSLTGKEGETAGAFVGTSSLGGGVLLSIIDLGLGDDLDDNSNLTLSDIIPMRPMSRCDLREGGIFLIMI